MLSVCHVFGGHCGIRVNAKLNLAIMYVAEGTVCSFCYSIAKSLLMKKDVGLPRTEKRMETREIFSSNAGPRTNNERRFEI